MKEINCIQGSAEWHRARLGVVTASEVSRIITPKGALAKNETSRAYMHKLLAEWALGEPVEEFHGTPWTERGLELEDEALAAFSLMNDVDARPLGFARHDDLPLGCSPDWWVDSWANEEMGEPPFPGGIEVKCPGPHTHVGYLLGDADVPAKYWPQVQFSMWVCGVDAWEFMSYHPNLPPFLAHVEPDAAYHDKLDLAIPEFLLNFQTAKQRLLDFGVTPKLKEETT